MKEEARRKKGNVEYRIMFADFLVISLTILRYYSNVTIYVTLGSLLSEIRLSSVTFVRPTQGVETLGNISSPFVP